jgi:hypothetical protein
MTENSSKGLTWATFAAGVASALLLAAIGCLKPVSAGDEASRLRSDLSPSAEAGVPQQRYISQESIQRAREANLPSSRH